MLDRNNLLNSLLTLHSDLILEFIDNPTDPLEVARVLPSLTNSILKLLNETSTEKNEDTLPDLALLKTQKEALIEFLESSLSE